MTNTEKATKFYELSNLLNELNAAIEIEEKAKRVMHDAIFDFNMASEKVEALGLKHNKLRDEVFRENYK